MKSNLQLSWSIFLFNKKFNKEFGDVNSHINCDNINSAQILTLDVHWQIQNIVNSGNWRNFVSYSTMLNLDVFVLIFVILYENFLPPPYGM